MTSQYKAASFLKRLGAMFYDLMLVVSFVIVVGFFSMAAMSSLLGIESVAAGSLVAKFFFVYLVFLSFVFYGWFWTHGGQTLGMRAWKLKLLAEDGGRISWLQAFFRFCYALLSWLPLGLGFLWVLIDKNNKAWHDKTSHTFIVDLS
ncbi:MAG: hypothetical protein CSB47_02270 [Proteobacteria bacterium]|nr:MAG: hypothetical protein CSB47_02270 [Pseudomonadota bacterium]